MSLISERGQITVVGGTAQYPIEYSYDDYGHRTDLYTTRSAAMGRDRTQWEYDLSTGLLTNKVYDDNSCLSRKRKGSAYEF